MIYDWHYGPAEVHTVGTLTDVVTQINWSCTAYAPDGTTYKKSGAVALGLPDPVTFTAFSTITAAQMQAWVFGSINKATIESQLSIEYTNRTAAQSVKQFKF